MVDDANSFDNAPNHPGDSVRQAAPRARRVVKAKYREYQTVVFPEEKTLAVLWRRFTGAAARSGAMCTRAKAAFSAIKLEIVELVFKAGGLFGDTEVDECPRPKRRASGALS